MYRKKFGQGIEHFKTIMTTIKYKNVMYFLFAVSVNIIL